MSKTLEQLCAELMSAKQAEASANELRVSIEKQLLAITGTPEEGSITRDVDSYKIHIEQKITRKLDEKKWGLIKDQIPEELRPVSIVETFKIEAKGVRWLKENESGYYKLMCSVMEEKPAKPSVKIEEVK